jgi:hypothetical protein
MNMSEKYKRFLQETVDKVWDRHLKDGVEFVGFSVNDESESLARSFIADLFFELNRIHGVCPDKRELASLNGNVGDYERLKDRRKMDGCFSLYHDPSNKLAEVLMGKVYSVTGLSSFIS